MTDRLYTLVAELTYACPLRCAYCSNPVTGRVPTIPAEVWGDVFRQAAALGVVQVTLTGGEPLLRHDLVEIVSAARAADLYVTLITSGHPAPDWARLRAAGLDAVQLSVQAADAATADAIAGVAVHADKRRAAAAIRGVGLPLTLNVVLHRGNIGQVAALVALAEELGAQRLELANVQLLGWALAHRDVLLPSAEAIGLARREAARAQRRLAGRMELLYVGADYHADRPRACMGGWGSRTLVVAPDGLVLPCQAARALPLPFERVGDRSLAEIWQGSALATYRGEGWMPEPCRGCPERERDHGGCRCQAFHLTGDAGATDPACARSPHHHRILAARAAAASPGLVALRARTSGVTS